MSAIGVEVARREVGTIAMLIVLVSLSMLFATLFLSYALYRSRAEIWPPVDFESIGLKLPTLNTTIICLSSASYALYQRTKARVWWGITLALGIGFLGLQFQFWNALKSQGLFAGTNVFSSMLYGFTWIHAGHLVLGLVALILVCPFLYTPGPLSISNVGKFWHFLGITWCLLYTGLFVV